MGDKYYFKNAKGELINFTSQIVCIFKTEDNSKYMVYTNNEKTDRGELMIYGATIDSENILIPIKKDEEYLIEDSIQILKEKYGNYYLGGEINE